jgi:redox-sensitive bicupin YhaK (pirin superfamily)
MSDGDKQLLAISTDSDAHWVGDGFPVRTLFDYSEGAAVSPFLLLDYAGPREFPPTAARLGVGEHPHRGFETVTIVYHGEVEHRDSSGGGGRIGPGDVQWMTAAGGLVHEEFHGRDFARRGGLFEMAQLWVNLPATDKLSPPHYQAILDAQIPAVRLPGEAGVVRVIAGSFGGARGPARTFTPIEVCDVRLRAGQRAALALPDGHNTLIAVLRGELRVGRSTIGEAHLARFDRRGTSITVEARQDTTALLLAGEPIDEPIVGMGPFVMNTREEIAQAVTDYQSGRMGHLAEAAG